MDHGRSQSRPRRQLSSASSNLSNAPVKLRRACAAATLPPTSRAPSASAGCYLPSSLQRLFYDETQNQQHVTNKGDNDPHWSSREASACQAGQHSVATPPV